MLPVLNNFIFAIALSTQLAPAPVPGPAPSAPVVFTVAPEFPGVSHPAYLGVGLRDVTDDRVAALKLKDARGVEVIALDHDGPAAKVGIREHDVILQMNGQQVASAEQLRRMMRETPAGRKADFVLSRDGDTVNVEVVLGDRAASEHAALNELPELNLQLRNIANGIPQNLADLDLDLGDIPMGFGPGSAARTGAQVESLGPQLARFFGAKDGVGILVKEVRPDSPASKAGLKAGDVIVRAAGQPVSGRVVWERLLRDNNGTILSIEVLRDKRAQKLTLAVAKRDQSFNSPHMQAMQAELAAAQAQFTPQQKQEMRESLQQATKDIQANRGEMDKAMAEVKKQMDSPEFKDEMAKTSAEASKAAAEFQNSDAWRDEMKQAEAEARKAADEWKQNPKMQEELQQEMQKAQQEMQKATEQIREQFTPMD